MDTRKVADAIDAQPWIEPAAKRLQEAVGKVYEAAGPQGQQVADALHGTWLGHPLHPALTDVPIGAWTVTAACDLIGAAGAGPAADAAADASLVVGLVGAVGSAMSGATDWHKTSGRARKIGFVHGVLNLTITGLYAGSWLLRKRGSRDAARALAMLGFAASGASAYLGGVLVYDEKIGVDHSRAGDMPEEWLDVAGEMDVREDQPLGVRMNDAPIVLVRHAGAIYALDATCSHLGGPLAEGNVEGGGIRCPWHGSRFALDDGRPLDGPSAFHQPCLETRIADGRVLVRRRAAAGPERLPAPAAPQQIPAAP